MASADPQIVYGDQLAAYAKPMSLDPDDVSRALLLSTTLACFGSAFLTAAIHKATRIFYAGSIFARLFGLS
jgi:hypothetical protein